MPPQSYQKLGILIYSLTAACWNACCATDEVETFRSVTVSFDSSRSAVGTPTIDAAAKCCDDLPQEST